MAISLKAAGTWARVVTDPSAVSLPGTSGDRVVGNRMFLFVTWKDYAITVADPNGWTPIGTPFADGSVSQGNGTGSVKVMAWYRDFQEGDTNPSLDWSSVPTEAHAVIMLWQKDAGDVWAVPTTVTAAIAAATTWSATASATTSVPSDSVVMGLVGFRDDSATMTRPATGTQAIDGSGVTWNGNYVESPATHFSSTTGNDMSGDLGHRFVTTGGSSITLTMAGTLSASETGAAKWVVQPILPAPSLNTPADAATLTDDTPDLAFTGTDFEGDALRYQVQVDTTNTFDSLSSGGVTYVTHVDLYLRKNNSPTDDLLLDIRETSFSGSSIAQSAAVTHDKVGASLGWVRFYFSTPVALTAGTRYFLTLSRSGTRDTTNYYKWAFFNTGGASSYSGGGNSQSNSGVWNAEGVVDFRFIVYDGQTALISQNTHSTDAGGLQGDGGTGEELGQGITGPSAPLLNKRSGTDPGFSGSPDNSDPFTSGQEVTFTIQAADALANGTYYWRVRAVDPSGSNTYGPWSAVRSFEMDAATGPDPLVADQASFTLTGQSAGLLYQRILVASHATFTLTGNATGLLRNFKIVAVQASYSLTLVDADFARVYRITCDTGTFAVSGQDVAWLRDLVMVAAQATFTLTGYQAALSRAQNLLASQATFTLTGNDTDLTVDRVLAAEQASFTLSGEDVELLKSYPLAAETGSFALSGQDANLVRELAFTADPAYFVLTADDVAFLSEVVMAAELAAYALTGYQAVLSSDRHLLASQESYTASLEDAEILAERLIDAAHETFTLTAENAEITATRVLLAASGTFSLSGPDVEFTYAPLVCTSYLLQENGDFLLQENGDQILLEQCLIALIAAYGSFTLNGQSAVLTVLRTLVANQATYTLTGNTASLNRHLIMSADMGMFSLMNQAASFERHLIMTAQTVSFAVSGQPAGFNLAPDADTASFTLTGFAAGLTVQRVLTADQATFTMTGNDVDFTGAISLTADTASFTMTGLAAQLTYNQSNEFLASMGQFTLTGQTAQLLRALKLTAEPASFAVTTYGAAFTRSRSLGASTASYTLTGVPIALLATRRINLEHGTNILTGVAAGLSRRYPLRATTAYFTLTRRSAIVIWNRTPFLDPFCPKPSLAKKTSPFTAKTSPFTPKTRPYTDRDGTASRPRKDC